MYSNILDYSSWMFDRWVQRTQAHIVVSIQYRLNIFGFPNYPALPDQNLGFLDQRLALEWLRDNVAAFGGNPQQMVLWGQSAGGWSTDIQDFGWFNDSIVQGYIGNSGSAYNLGLSSDLEGSNFTFVANAFNCSGESQALLDCLRQVPQLDIEAFLLYYTDSGQKPGISFDAIADGVHVFLNFSQRIADGQTSGKPHIYGVCERDYASLDPVTLDQLANGGPPGNTSDSASSASTGWQCSTAREVRDRQAQNLTTYRFQYDGNFSNISPLPWMGAYHSGDLPMLFGTYNDFRGNGTAFETATSEAMQDLWLAFAKDPEMGLQGMGWPATSTGQLVLFGGATPWGFGVANQTVQAVNASVLDANCAL